MSEILIQIEQIDDSLRILREASEDAKPADKAKWADKINAALDKRLILMRARDAGTEKAI